MTVAAVVLARSDSARLPGKALLPVGGRLLIDLVLDRLRRSVECEIVLATTMREVDDELAAHAAAAGVVVHRGAVDDVASRFLAAAAQVGAELAVRVNGDSPFVDPQLLDPAAALAVSSNADLVSNLPGRTFPYGVAVEVVRCSSMHRVIEQISAADREHVTKHLYERDDIEVRSIVSPRPDLAGVRMTVDLPADLATLRSVADRLGDRIVDVTWMEAAEAYRAVEEQP